MAFCTSCGAQVADSSQFCTQCGKPLPASVPVQTSATARATVPTSARGGGGALKVILIVVAVIVAGGIVLFGVLGFFVQRMVRHSRVSTRGGETTVTTPLGTVQTSKDAKKIAEQIGVDLYPGATPQNEGSSSVNMAGGSMVTVTLLSADPSDKVASFYKERYPGLTSGEGGSYHMMRGDQNDLLTINIEPSGGRTQIQISRMRR